MAEDAPLSAKDFGASFRGFMEKLASEAPTEDPPFLQRLRAHFGADPGKLPIVTESFPKTEQPNLHLAIESYLKADGRESELLGIAMRERYLGVDLAQLVAPARGGIWAESGPAEGPVQYVSLPVDDCRSLTCVQSGLYLVRDGDRRHAFLMCGPSDSDWMGRARLEVMSADRSAAEEILRTVRTAMRRENVYRGRVISLGLDNRHLIEVRFHRLRPVTRDEIILPNDLLDRIERLTIGFTRHGERLKAAGRHLKRGLLLHGHPGTGKTLTAMYLAGQMRDRTVLLLTGSAQTLLEESCSMARILEPSTVIIEDVDLIAEERTMPGRTCSALLFELMNLMDGLADDADVLFLLTTNRPDAIEPALASRPGRVDQAFELPLPDADCRRRLLQLYARGLDLAVADLDPYVRRSEGASGAFIREMLRKAALFAADEGDAVVVRERHLDAAIHELVVQGGEMTRSLLGAKGSTLGFGAGGPQP